MADKKERQEIDFNKIMRDVSGREMRIDGPAMTRLGTVAVRGLVSCGDPNDDEEKTLRRTGLAQAIINDDYGEGAVEDAPFQVLKIPSTIVTIIDKSIFAYSKKVDLPAVYRAAHSALYPDEEMPEFDDIEVVGTPDKIEANTPEE